MISIRSLSLPLFALVATLAGCSAESGTASGAESVDTAKTPVVAQTDTAERPEHGPGGHHRGPGGPGGPDFLVGAALHAPINLTAEQRTTIEGLAKANRPERPAFDATKAKELAAAVRAGNVDALPKPAFDDAKMKEHLAASAKSLATLHDTLTPTQRAALVDDINSHAAKGGPDRAHGLGGPRGPEAKGGPGGEHHPGIPFGGIELSEAQKQQLKAKAEAGRPAAPSAEKLAAMKQNMETMRAQMKTKLETFKGDSFDATAFVTPPAGITRPEAPKGNPLADLVSVLTPAQRETLAQKIEQGPPAK